MIIVIIDLFINLSFFIVILSLINSKNIVFILNVSNINGRNLLNMKWIQ